MKWFKHYADNYRGRSIQDLLEKLGHTGLCYYLLQEMCAEKLEQKPAGRLTEADCLFTFRERFVRQMLRISATTLRQLLDTCATNGLLSWRLTGNEIEIGMPILLILLDSDHRRARAHRAQNARMPSLDKEEERDKEKESDKDSSSEVAKALNSKVWDAYKAAYFLRYKLEPKRNASVNAKISQLAKRLGTDAIQVVSFFVNHPDAFYVKSMHAIGLCLRDAESLYTQWRKGRAVTSNDIRNYERNQGYQQIMEDIDRGGI